MTLATATPEGPPAARIVLLREFDQSGCVFYTNYQSPKGRDLAANPRAALLLFWSELKRQVRIEGRVEILSPEESDAYFRSRPYGHQVSAWASPQSQVIGNREILEESVLGLREKFATQVPRPAHWGGYRVVPDLFEFWQGRDNRLHDRLRYCRQ